MSFVYVFCASCTIDAAIWFISYFIFVAQFEPNRNLVQSMYIGLIFFFFKVCLVFFFVEGNVVYKQNVLYLITEPLRIS